MIYNSCNYYLRQQKQKKQHQQQKQQQEQEQQQKDRPGTIAKEKNPTMVVIVGSNHLDGMCDRLLLLKEQQQQQQQQQHTMSSSMQIHTMMMNVTQTRKYPSSHIYTQSLVNNLNIYTSW